VFFAFSEIFSENCLIISMAYVIIIELIMQYEFIYILGEVILDALKIVGGIILIIASIIIIIFTMMQESKQPGGMSAFTGQSDSYFSKNKSKTLEAKLALGTKVFIAAFFILAIALNLIVRYVV
jgi:preprotein translocase subunit SecG